MGGGSERGGTPSSSSGGGRVTKEIPVPMLSFRLVRVYEERAEVRRDVRVRADRGQMELVFSGFPAGVNWEMVRVEARTKSLVVRQTGLDDRVDKGSEADKLKKELKRMRREREEVEAGLRGVKARQTLWTTAADGVKTMDATAVAAYVETMRVETDKLFTAEAKSQAEIAKLTRKIVEGDGKLEQLKKLQLRMTVQLEVKETELIELELIYWVTPASWSPHYDIRFESATKHMKLCYLAVVKQKSGEEWRDTKVQVHNGSGATTKMPMQSTLMALKRMGPDEESKPPPERSLVTGFEIAGRRSIPGDGGEQRLLVTEADLEPAIEYYTIPKESPQVYIKAKVALKSAYALLPGPVFSYRDSSFVGRTQLARMVLPKEEFMCGLGVESSVRVEYQSMVEKMDSGVAAGKTRTLTATRVSAKNKGKEKLRLTVLEQIPLVRDPGSGLRVVIARPHLDSGANNNSARPSTATAAANDTHARLNRFNYIEWNAELPPEENRQFDAKYVTESPAGEEIVFK